MKILTPIYLYPPAQVYLLIELNYSMDSNMEERFRNISKCDICLQGYNRLENVPVIVCTMHHTICIHCLDGMEGRPSCPFCREKIIFKKVALNYYILELLPEEGSLRPGSRSQIDSVSQYRGSNVFYKKHEQSTQLQSLDVLLQLLKESVRSGRMRLSSSNQEAQRAISNSASINIRPLSYVYSNRQNLLQEEERYMMDYQRRIWHKLTTRFLTYIQLPFIVINILIFLLSPQSQCMDTAHGLSFMVLRPWLFVVGGAELVLFCGIICTNWLSSEGIIDKEEEYQFGQHWLQLQMLKIFVWTIIELGLFMEDMIWHCSAGMVVYGGLLIAVHLVEIMLYLFCSRRMVAELFWSEGE